MATQNADGNPTIGAVGSGAVQSCQQPVPDLQSEGTGEIERVITC